MTQAIIKSKGIRIRVKAGIDLTSATTLEIRYTKPDGTTGKFTGVYVFEDSEHYVYYITQNTTNIDQAGNWKFEIYAVGASYELHGTKVAYKFVAEMSGTFT